MDPRPPGIGGARNKIFSWWKIKKNSTSLGRSVIFRKFLTHFHFADFDLFILEQSFFAPFFFAITWFRALIELQLASDSIKMSRVRFSHFNSLFSEKKSSDFRVFCWWISQIWRHLQNLWRRKSAPNFLSRFRLRFPRQFYNERFDWLFPGREVLVLFGNSWELQEPFYVFSSCVK